MLDESDMCPHRSSLTRVAEITMHAARESLQTRKCFSEICLLGFAKAACHYRLGSGADLPALDELLASPSWSR